MADSAPLSAERIAQRRMTCPKCRRVAYVVCSNKKCSCWRSVPSGKKPLKWTKDEEHQRCAYCGFTAHVDYWFERDMRAVPLEGLPHA